MRKSYFAPDDRPKKPFPLRLMLLLLFNTVLIFGLYCYLVMRQNINWIFWIYYGATAAVALAYLIYNRGLSRDKITPAELPRDWSENKKEAFFRERDERKQKSKWLLTLLFPLCLTILFDMIYLFFGERITEIWNQLVEIFRLS
jgi:hypothetical protein